MTGNNYTKVNPVGVDVAIQKLQNHLFSKLDWDNCEVFGRVYKLKSEKGLVPRAFIDNKDYKDVFTDDRKTSTIFFVDEDKHTTKEGIKFECDVKIVFMVDLKKAIPEITHRADMEVEQQVVELIRSRSNFKINALEKGLEIVLKEFNKENLEKTDMQPFHVFSISGVIDYQFSCFN